jgi:zinc/manganese transport system substrate-binding protein
MILIRMITILIMSHWMRNRICIAWGVIAFSLTVLTAACDGDTAETADDRPEIVATTSIWGDVVAQIVGEDATVSVVVPNGADAHEYEASPRQVAELIEADLVVTNGLGLEAGLEDLLETALADGANIYEVAPDLDPIEFPAHELDLDPHVWFDPERMALAARLISEHLAEIDDSVDWEARAAEYATNLQEVDQEMAATLEGVAPEDRKLVTNHESLGYLADRYGFEVIAVVIPGGSSLGQPSSAEMAALVSEIEEEDVDVIFAETTQPTRLAEAVAAEVGDDVEVVELYTESLGDPGSGADTLIGMLSTDAGLIGDALSS